MSIWILSSNMIKIMSTFRSSALCLMPPQLHERVGKWTHEPRSNLNNKKHLSDTFICTFIFSTKLFWKYKNIFTYLHTHIKPKNFIAASYLPYCISHFIFYLRSHLMLDNHSVELGTQEQGICFADCSKKNHKSFCDYSPRVWYKPRVFSWGKFTFSTTLCTWSPNLAHLLSVISRRSSYRSSSSNLQNNFLILVSPTPPSGCKHKVWM
jgi:hypothetical protein